MGRWEPGARERLHAAALRLFAENGYEQTTAAQIAAAAGLTERTFFRHFADKREVLFESRDRLAELVAHGVADAPAGSSPLSLAAAGILAADAFFDAGRRAYARERQVLIDANPALRERERHKLAELADTVHGALVDRGVGEPAARLAAESAVIVFTASFAQWIRAGERRSFGELAAETLDAFTRLAGPA